MPRKILVLAALLVMAVAGSAYWLLREEPTSKSTQTTTNTPQKTPNQNKPATPEKTPPEPQFSLEDPASIWVVVNKQRPLPATYVPGDLVAIGQLQMRFEATTALQSLLNAATANGTPMQPISGYRSYTAQSSVYNNYVKRDGQAKADTYSARPGHSEHQTGLVMDLGNGTCDLEICFGNTAAGKWLAAHAHEYGFIIRYLDGKTAVTGYQYEPWHIRYVGTDLAKKLHDSQKTMEEYFNLPAAPNY